MAEQFPPRPSSARRGLTLTEPYPRSRGPQPFLPRHRRTWSMTLPPSIDPRSMPADVPNPSHRHGTPSGPWPFLDLHVQIDPKDIIAPEVVARQCFHRQYPGEEHCWCGYPQSLYPNWTPVQQQASRILEALKSRHGWRVYPLVISKNGIFTSLPHKSGRHDSVNEFWDTFRPQSEEAKDSLVHAIFIDNMAGPIMQMLGTKYNIEPFFFSSSFGWIPSRYQESVIPKESDHITITLTFIHCINDPSNEHIPEPDDDDESFNHKQDKSDQAQRNIAIKTNEFLFLHSNEKILFSDIISLHMIRHPTEGHTLISYHAPGRFRATSASKLRERFQLIGCSVYWSKIFERSRDPTFSLLGLLWYALYAWDESLEALYNHICYLESDVLENTKLDFTQELHRIRAHLLHYTDLLEDFKKTVTFIKEAHYPALDNEHHFTPEDKEGSMNLMDQECKNILREIDRLEMTRKMQDRRLTNVMQLGFSTVNILDSKRMRKLTEAAVRDSAAMKQVAYLTMVFLPASFVATAFGMNVQEINSSKPSLGQYFATAIPLTAITVWIVGALQIHIKDPPTSRLRPESSKQKRNIHDITSASYGETAPFGHGLRPAFTASEGEIVITPQTNSVQDTDDDYIDNFDDHDHTDDKYNPDRDVFKQQSIWKRLSWPVSLLWYAFLYLQEQWREVQHRRKNAHSRSDGDQERDPDPSSLPMHCVGNFGNKKKLTPAARIAADVRSSHSNSTRSVEEIRRNDNPPTLPPPILKHEGVE